MDISGKIIQVLQEQTGEGRNGKWSKCDFVIETQDKFPKKVCITAWGDLIQTVRNIPAGSDVKVSFDISSREYNGKWYTDVKAWKVEGGSAQQGGGYSRAADTNDNDSNVQMQGTSTERHISEDDLPF